MKVEAAVFHKVHEPLTIETVEMDKPRAREIIVRTVATGVCHSDLHVMEGLGRYPTDRPFVLGHEGAGVVEAVGDDVTAVRVGDHVVACLSGFCGTCPQCLSGHPNVCTGGIVTRPETGFSSVGVTDTSGIARFLSLAPGNYAVEFTLEGFAPIKEPRLVLLICGPR